MKTNKKPYTLCFMEGTIDSGFVQWKQTTRTVLYLRSNVVRRSTKGPGGDTRKYVFFTHSKICDLNVTICVQHYVIQFQIPGQERQSELPANLL